MNILFQTGTGLTAKNLNLANLVNAKAGVLSGCSVYDDGGYLYVSSGTVMFNDGSIVVFDGNEYVDASALSGNGYHLLAVMYGNDVELELSLVYPEKYEYVELATVDAGTSITIVNAEKSNEVKKSVVIDGPQLRPAALITDEGVISCTEVVNSVYNDKETAVVVDNNGIVYVPFTHPDFNIRNLTLFAELSNDTTLAVSVNVNGVEEYRSQTLTATDFTDGSFSFNVGDSLLSGSMGDRCSVKVVIGQNSNENNVDSDLVLHSIVLKNSN